MERISRRTFLKRMGYATIAFQIGGGLAWANKRINITFSTMFPTSYYWVPVTQRFIKRVEERTNGEVKFAFYHSKQLFGGKEEVPALQRGEIDMCIPNANYHAGTVKGSDVGALPFLWKDVDDAWKSLKAGLWEQGLNQKWEKINILILAQSPGGFYHFGTKKRPILKPQDLKGMTIAISSTVHAKMVEELRGAPSFMSSGELYTALQRGAIDGILRPFLTYTGRKLHEVLDHLTITNAGNYTILMAANKNSWAKIPKGIQKVLRQCAWEWAEDGYKATLESDAKAIDLLKSRGMKIHSLDEATFGEFKASIKKVYDWWIGQVPDGKKLIDFIEAHH